MYYTKYTPDDPQFGHKNSDVDYWTQEHHTATRGFPSYRMVNGTDDPNVRDEVEFAINQIEHWQAIIAQNEQDKLLNANAPSKTDNFAYEMWFRGTSADKNNGEAMLMSVRNRSTSRYEQVEGQTCSVTRDTLTTIGFADGKLRLRLDNTQFNFTASADEIYFSFPDASLPQMDGNDFVVTVSNIKDGYGNSSEPVSWKFHADFASVKWNNYVLDRTKRKAWNQPLTWTELLNNARQYV